MRVEVGRVGRVGRTPEVCQLINSIFHSGPGFNWNSSFRYKDPPLILFSPRNSSSLFPPSHPSINHFPLLFGPHTRLPLFSYLNRRFSVLLHPTCLWPASLYPLSLSFSRQTMLPFHRVPLSSNSSLTRSRRFTPPLQVEVASWYLATCFLSFVLGYDEVFRIWMVTKPAKYRQLMNAFSSIPQMVLWACSFLVQSNYSVLRVLQSTNVGHSDGEPLDDELDAETMFSEKRPTTSRGPKSRGLTNDVVFKVCIFFSHPFFAGILTEFYD